MQVLYKIRRQGIAGNLRAKDFYRVPTIKGLAKLIESETAATAAESPSLGEQALIKANQVSMQASFGLLPIQGDFFKAKMVKSNHYNQAFTIHLPTNHTFSFETISSAIQQLATHHSILKCVFKDQQHVYHQDNSSYQIHDMFQKQLTEDDLTDLNSSLDIEKGPVWKVACHSGYKVFFVFHHLIIDVVSWSVIAEDFKTILTGGTLGPKTCSYDQWVAYVQNYSSKIEKSQLSYWKRQQDSITNLWDTTDTMVKSSKMLNADQTTQLLSKACQTYNTQPNELLLAALALTLSKLSGKKHHAVTLEGIGRMNPDDLDVSRTVGWFTTMFPFQLYYAASQHDGDIGSVIMHIKEAFRKVPDKGLGYGALVQSGKLDNAEVAPVIFNYLGKIGGGGTDDASTAWEIAPNEPTGVTVADGNRDTNAALEMNCYVNTTSGELEIHITSYFDTNKTNQFCATFMEAVGKVLSHTSKLETAVTTPSDYSISKNVNLTIDWLQRVQSKLASYKIQALYTATSLQQAFIAHAISHPGDDAYCTQFMFDYNGAFDVNAYRRAWDYTIQAFPTLRCAFDWEGPEPLMVVVGHVEPPDIDIIDIRNDSRTVEDVRLADREVVYDLSRPCLIR